MNAEGNQPSESDIVARMQAIRTQLPEDVQRVRGDVERVRGRVSELTSLRYYMKQYPLPLLGLAATAGFALVPSLKSMHRVLDQGSDHGPRSTSTKQKVAESSAKGSMLGGFIATAASLLARRVLSTAVESAVNKFTARPTAHPMSGHYADSPLYDHSDPTTRPDPMLRHDR